jgi:sugar phosphate isomerase/epimerase
VKLAAQLYTLRQLLDEDVQGTLRALASAGAKDVELAGLYGRSASEFRALLDGAGLAAVSMHVPLERFENEAVLDEARTLGVQTLVVPWVPAPETDEEADALVARVVAAGELARGAGHRFAYHNHDFEFGEPDLWSRIIASDVDLEPDVGWLQVAGRDPVTELNALGGRVGLVHAKDVRRDGSGWRDVPAGDGELDFAAIARAAESSGATHLVVELDNPSDDPVEDVRRSLENLAAVL